MIKKSILSSFIVSVFLYGSTEENINKQLETELQNSKSLYNYNVSVYGAGEKVSDTSYKGFGIKFDSDYSEIVLEKGSDYKRGSVVQRIDIDNRFYSKIGLGYLKREETINDNLQDITQVTVGGSLGYGDDINYNIEIGYIANKLKNAGDSDTTTKIYYTEAVLKQDIESYGSIDGVFSYQSAKAYNKRVSDHSGSIGYYPISDMRMAMKYNSIEHDNDNYRISAGINYKFDSLDFTNGELSPTAMFTRNTTENIAWVVEYKKAISNRSLKMRDKFEEQINTTQIVAKQVAPQEFQNRTTSTVINTAIEDSTDPNVLVSEIEATKIYFESNSFAMSGIEEAKVDTLVSKINTLINSHGYRIKISGNTDENGTDEENYALGLKMAKTVKDRLVAQSVNTNKIMMVSFGESNPICLDSNEACWSQNRRVFFNMLP